MRRRCAPAQFSTLEIYVYEEAQDNLFAHHDIPLPVFPLCIEWMDFTPGAALGTAPGAAGNMAAIGTFAPHIEVCCSPSPPIHTRLHCHLMHSARSGEGTNQPIRRTGRRRFNKRKT